MLKFIETNNIAQKQSSIIKFSEKFATEIGKKKEVKSIIFKSLKYFLRERNKAHLK